MRPTYNGMEEWWSEGMHLPLEEEEDWLIFVVLPIELLDWRWGCREDGIDG